MQKRSHPLMVPGLDVSRYQGEIDWPAVYEAGYRFAFARASMGDERPPLLVDAYFKTNMENGNAAGMLMGAYHFAYPDYNEPESEARHFLNIAGEYLGPEYLPPALDIERGSALGKQALSEWICVWMEMVGDIAGVKPVLYTSTSYAAQYLTASVTRYSLWIAHWTFNPAVKPDTGIWNDWAFWQFSDSGSIPGIEGAVDLDIGRGILICD